MPRPPVATVEELDALFLERPSENRGITAEQRVNPAAFARECLGVTLWSAQEKICRAVAEHSYVAVRSGHKTGKTNVATVVALWWTASHPAGRVIMTSAGDRQVRHVLWRELTRIVKAAKGLRGIKKLNELPALGLQYEDGREILGFTSKDPETAAGFSGGELLYIVDEASGVSEPIFEAVRGNLAGGGHILMLGNPTQTSGTFFDAWHEGRSGWHTIHVSSRDTPNVKEGRTVISGLAERGWCEKMLAEYGPDSPIYHVRVLGNFPTQGKNAVVPLGLVEAAIERWKEQATEIDGELRLTGSPADGPLELGVDVARYGDDDSVVVARRGRKVLEIAIRHGMNTIEVAGLVEDVARRHAVEGEDKASAKVDDCGVGGGVVDQLQESKRVEVVAVNAASASTSEDDFMNLRSQMHFGVADWLKDGGIIPDDGELMGELVAPTYSFDARGRRKVESKDEIKKRLPSGKSPDKADALALAVYGGAVVTEENARIFGRVKSRRY